MKLQFVAEVAFSEPEIHQGLIGTPQSRPDVALQALRDKWGDDDDLRQKMADHHGRIEIRLAPSIAATRDVPKPASVGGIVGDRATPFVLTHHDIGVLLNVESKLIYSTDDIELAQYFRKLRLRLMEHSQEHGDHGK